MDGFHCQLPPDDPTTAYVEGQYGRPQRIDLRTLRPTAIRPRPNAPKSEWRFNWSTPMTLSPHDSKTLYLGGNVVFKTTDRGLTYRVISPDLTRGKPGQTYPSQGHTLTALAESPLVPGLLFAGSDDGRVHLSRNDGGEWEDLTDRLPGTPGLQPGSVATGHVTRIEPSSRDAGTFYVALDRHRQDDYRPHLFRSRDGGRSFERISAGLPKEGPVHVIREDPRNHGLLFAGTEFGLFASFDDAFSWQRLECGLPPVAVHDLVIHPTERELVIGTHGRAIWVLDIAPLQDLTLKRRAEVVTLFAPRPARWPAPPVPPVPNSFAGDNPPPGIVLHYRLAGRLGTAGSLQVLTRSGEAVRKAETAVAPGLHSRWFPTLGLKPGEYTARLTAGGRTLEQPVILPAAPIPVKPVEE
jgi:hypothetical protein